MNTTSHNQHPFSPLHRQAAPFATSDSPAATDSSEPETPDPEYLVPVLAVYDDPEEADYRERATALYCQGHRTADIAVQLHVPVSTIRSWLKDARYLLATELRASREQHLLRAIESARALAAEAWTAYERDCQLQREILAGEHDRLRRRVTRLDRSSPRRRPALVAEPPTTIVGASDEPSPAIVGASGGRPRDEHPRDEHPPIVVGASGGRPRDAMPDPDADGDLLYEEYERPRYTSQAAKFLAVALAAQREVARLQGLYAHVAQPPQPVDVTITGPRSQQDATATATAGDPMPVNPPDPSSPEDDDPSSAPQQPPRSTNGESSSSHAGPELAAGVQPTNLIPIHDNANLTRDNASRAHDSDPGPSSMTPLQEGIQHEHPR